jgi:uncharacterized protein YjcR
MKVTQRHRDIAKLIWEDKITQGEMAKQFNISQDTISLWKREPEFQALLDELDKEAQASARRVLLKYSERASKVLVKLTEEKDGNFLHGEETVRKSAVDILEAGGVKSTEASESGSGRNIIIIRNGNGNKA